MKTLEQIIAIAYNNRENIADEVYDAFSDTVSFKVISKGSAPTFNDPGEAPEFEINGYDEYEEWVQNAIIGTVFGDSWDISDETLIGSNLKEIMNAIDVEFFDEETYCDKGYEYANENYGDYLDNQEAKAYDYYMEHHFDRY